jgi:chemotaxis protein methyltransferase CheR
MIADITDEEVLSLTQSILARYGLDFTCYEPKSLRRRIIRILNNFEFQSIHDLWVKILREPAFIQVFMNEISVGMTSMFRDPVLWRNLKKRVNSEFENRSISIWHSGCSTGEEVFSMGILLKETNTLSSATAFASDINKNALEEARAGIYHKIKMIENETNYKQFNMFSDFGKYYIPNGKYATMETPLTKHVTYAYHNLINDSFPKGFDIVFCRNVMIYFDNMAKLKLVDKFHACLNPGGYFIIGFFDTMSHLIDNNMFELVDWEAKIFKKI